MFKKLCLTVTALAATCTVFAQRPLIFCPDAIVCTSKTKESCLMIGGTQQYFSITQAPVKAGEFLRQPSISLEQRGTKNYQAICHYTIKDDHMGIVNRTTASTSDTMDIQPGHTNEYWGAWGQNALGYVCMSNKGAQSCPMFLLSTNIN